MSSTSRFILDNDGVSLYHASPTQTDWQPAKQGNGVLGSRTEERSIERIAERKAERQAADHRTGRQPVRRSDRHRQTLEQSSL